LVVRNLSQEEKTTIRTELQKEQYDLIHAENFYVMTHIPKTNTPVLLTEQTILYRVYQHFVESLPWYFFWLKPILAIDILKLKFWEVYYWKHSDFLAAVSEDDSIHIKKLTGRKKVAVIPNGVDFRFYSKRIYQRFKNPTILFGAADFHWMQNKEGAVLLLDKVWPLVKKAVPKAKLWIVGKTAPLALKKYLRREDVLIEEIGESREAYQKAWVLTAPMRSGGGSRTKLFEAMASGLPIVTTSEGAEGIGAKNGMEIVIENDLETLAKKTAALLLNGKKSETISKNARNLVREKYDWNQSAALLSKVYKEIGK
jgi:glycosyltransferase involved in cell wall biosynthesis